MVALQAELKETFGGLLESFAAKHKAQTAASTEALQQRLAAAEAASAGHGARLAQVAGAASQQLQVRCRSCVTAAPAEACVASPGSQPVTPCPATLAAESQPVVSDLFIVQITVLIPISMACRRRARTRLLQRGNSSPRCARTGSRGCRQTTPSPAAVVSSAFRRASIHFRSCPTLQGAECCVSSSCPAPDSN